MYNSELEPSTISIEQLFLDPNNPRFWTEKESREIPDKKFTDPKVQEQTQKEIEKYGVEELYNSILRNGFLPLDRIVVRAIQGHGDKYVAVEGNRRLAAVKLLRKRIEDNLISEEGIDEEYLANLKSSVDKLEVLIYKGSHTSDISWMLQGIRHISGIRDWQPAQRARLIAQQIDQGEDGNKISYKQAGQKFGLSAQAVGRLYRAYKGLIQMREDDDYGPKARNDYFSLFEESYKNQKVREWLGWDDTTFKFNNNDQLKQFYSWIAPDSDHNDDRRIHDPKQIQKLSLLIEKKRDDLIGQIDRYEVSIDGAAERAVESPGPSAWHYDIQKAKTLLEGLPITKIAMIGHEEAIESLRELSGIIDRSIKAIEAASTSSNE